MTTIDDRPAAASARSEGPSVQEIMVDDLIEAPATLRQESFEDLGSADIPVERYISKRWHDLEVEHVWKRVWQLACREEELPEVGSTLVYDVADLSILIVRSAPGELKAFHNACLHRGTQLRVGAGYVPELRCPFHGFTWALDGALKSIPCEWDFPHIDKQSFGLPEVQVATWGGWVFVNPDVDAPPLADHLGSFTEHFVWDTTKRYKSAHVQKIMRCNWKTCLEAFMESFHVIATHPQILLTLGDANTQYDTFPNAGGPGWNRMITAGGVASPHLGPDVHQDDILNAVVGQYGVEGGLTVPDGQTARQALASMMRLMRFSGGTPASVPGDVVSDAEALDAILYYVFPNFQPWAGMTPINYRFRPHGNNPDECIMDVMFLSDFDQDSPRPAPAAITYLGADDDWTMASELGTLAMVFNQDTGNLPRVQRGMHTMTKPGITLGNYQESRIRQFHHELSLRVGQ